MVWNGNKKGRDGDHHDMTSFSNIQSDNVSILFHQQVIFGTQNLEYGIFSLKINHLLPLTPTAGLSF